MQRKLENALLFMWTISLVATLGSLYFSEIQLYEPCKLCWYQRILMYPLVLILGIAYIQRNVKIAVTSAVFATIGFCIGAYHYSIQKVAFLQEHAAACGRIPCTGQYINWFGFVTIPFLSLTAFLLIGITSFYMIKQLKKGEI